MSSAPFFLTTVCPALLPPANNNKDNDIEYFEVLGLEKNASIGEVRKAYKKKSLQLHPDKVAQRNGDAQQAKLEYEKIQTAHSVLTDDRKRQLYISFNYSASRFQFVETGNLVNPIAVHGNLQQASCSDKTRLFSFLLLCIVILLLQPILIALQVNDTMDDVSWFVVLIPLWIILGLHISVQTLIAVVTIRRHARDGNNKHHEDSVAAQILRVIEALAWLAGAVLLAWQWDNRNDNPINWHYVSIPFYLALLARMGIRVALSNLIQHSISNMISTEYLQKVIGLENNDDELPDDFEYIVVQEDPDAVAGMLSMMLDDHHPMSDEDVEAVRVQTSHEFQTADAQVRRLRWAIANHIFFFIPFCALVAAKLDEQIMDASWWIIFLPLWLRVGLPFIYYGLTCCCSVPPDVFIIEHGKDDDDDEDSKKVEPSGDFAAAEGDIPELSEIKSAPSERGDLSEVNTGDVSSGTTTTTNKNAVAESEMTAAQSGEAATNDPVEDAPKGSEKEEKKKQHDKDEIPEEFKRFQERFHGEEESDYMESKFKSMTSCCWLGFQIIILCLVVGAIEEDYNAFWVLFPIFLASSVVALCCLCCIYAPGDPLSSMDGPAAVNDDDKEEKAPAVLDEEAPAVVNGEAPAVAAASSQPTTAEVAQDEGQPQDDEDPTGASSMEELD